MLRLADRFSSLSTKTSPMTTSSSTKIFVHGRLFRMEHPLLAMEKETITRRIYLALDFSGSMAYHRDHLLQMMKDISLKDPENPFIHFYPYGVLCTKMCPIDVRSDITCSVLNRRINDGGTKFIPVLQEITRNIRSNPEVPIVYFMTDGDAQDDFVDSMNTMVSLIDQRGGRCVPVLFKGGRIAGLDKSAIRFDDYSQMESLLSTIYSDFVDVKSLRVQFPLGQSSLFVDATSSPSWGAMLLVNPHQKPTAVIGPDGTRHVFTDVIVHDMTEAQIEETVLFLLSCSKAVSPLDLPYLRQFTSRMQQAEHRQLHEKVMRIIESTMPSMRTQAVVGLSGQNRTRVDPAELLQQLCRSASSYRIGRVFSSIRTATKKLASVTQKAEMYRRLFSQSDLPPCSMVVPEDITDDLLFPVDGRGASLALKSLFTQDFVEVLSNIETDPSISAIINNGASTRLTWICRMSNAFLQNPACTEEHLLRLTYSPDTIFTLPYANHAPAWLSTILEDNIALVSLYAGMLQIGYPMPLGRKSNYLFLTGLIQALKEDRWDVFFFMYGYARQVWAFSPVGMRYMLPEHRTNPIHISRTSDTMLESVYLSLGYLFITTGCELNTYERPPIVMPSIRALLRYIWRENCIQMCKSMPDLKDTFQDLNALNSSWRDMDPTQYELDRAWETKSVSAKRCIQRLLESIQGGGSEIHRVREASKLNPQLGTIDHKSAHERLIRLFRRSSPNPSHLIPSFLNMEEWESMMNHLRHWIEESPRLLEMADQTFGTFEHRTTPSSVSDLLAMDEMLIIFVGAMRDLVQDHDNDLIRSVDLDDLSLLVPYTDEQKDHERERTENLMDSLLMVAFEQTNPAPLLKWIPYDILSKRREMLTTFLLQTSDRLSFLQDIKRPEVWGMISDPFPDVYETLLSNMNPQPLPGPRRIARYIGRAIDATIPAGILQALPEVVVPECTINPRWQIPQSMYGPYLQKHPMSDIMDKFDAIEVKAGDTHHLLAVRIGETWHHKRPREDDSRRTEWPEAVASCCGGRTLKRFKK